MFTIVSLLVPIDFSENAGQALSYAKELARTTNASLHLIHVVEPIVYPADWSYAQVGFADIEQELKDTASKEMDALAVRLKAEGFSVVTAVRMGRAADEICAYAEEHKISIISMGTHGRSGLEHFLFGSTTERVLRKALCPILAVRYNEDKKT